MRIWPNKISCLSLVSCTCRWQGGRTRVEGLLSVLKLSYYIKQNLEHNFDIKLFSGWHSLRNVRIPEHNIYMTLYRRPDCSLTNTHFFLLFLKNCVAWTLRSHGIKLSAGQSRVQWCETKGLTWWKKGSLSRCQELQMKNTNKNLKKLKSFIFINQCWNQSRLSFHYGSTAQVT